MLITFIILIGSFVIWLLLRAPKPSVQITQKTSSETVEDKLVSAQVITESQALQVTSESTIEEYNPYESEVFKAQVQDIAEQYQDTARFPVNSQPIRNIADARVPEPFEETEVETPFETESGDVIGISAAVDKFQYFSNETINVRLSLSGVPEGVFVDATATVSGPQGDTSLKADLEAVNANQSLLIGALDTSLVSQQLFSKEMIVKVLIDIGGEPFFTTVSFSYSLSLIHI